MRLNAAHPCFRHTFARTNSEITRSSSLWHMLISNVKVHPPFSSLDVTEARAFYIANPICPSPEAPTLSEAFRVVGRGTGQSCGTIFLRGGSVVAAPSSALVTGDVNLVVVAPKTNNHGIMSQGC